MALTPYMTYSGAAFPIVFGTTSAAVTNGAVVVKSGAQNGADLQGGTWAHGADPNVSIGAAIGVCLQTNAAAVGTATVPICLITDDVVFLATGVTAGANAGPFQITSTTGTVTNNAAAANGHTCASIIGPSPDGVSTSWLVRIRCRV